MSLASPKYFIFLAATFVVFHLAGERARWFVLLTSSMLFYAAFTAPSLLVVLGLVTAITYYCGLLLDRDSTRAGIDIIFWGGTIANLLILACMKYLPVMLEKVQGKLSVAVPDASFHTIGAFAAVGVSYYVFQAVSYLCDIYRGVVKPERHLGYFALHLAFFPKLLQGPIERAGHLIPQLSRRYELNYDNIRYGLLLLVWGLFKKVLIADRLGLYVDAVYDHVHAWSGLPMLAATCLYSFQIYFDFSAYTEMALGSALLFNINLTPNFNAPYRATSIADFWRRWHISFSRWILDYIFTPLQLQWRNRGTAGTVAALGVTFLVSGAWHGARWGFLIWGALHGLYMACSVLYKPYQKKLHKALGLEKTRLLGIWQVLVTFSLVSFSWIFFRAATVADGMHIVLNMFSSTSGNMFGDFMLVQGMFQLQILVGGVIVYLGLNNIIASKAIFQWGAVARWGTYVAVVELIILFKTNGAATFIYSQF